MLQCNAIAGIGSFAVTPLPWIGALCIMGAIVQSMLPPLALQSWGVTFANPRQAPSVCRSSVKGTLGVRRCGHR